MLVCDCTGWGSVQWEGRGSGSDTDAKSNRATWGYSSMAPQIYDIRGVVQSACAHSASENFVVMTLTTPIKFNVTGLLLGVQY